MERERERERERESEEEEEEEKHFRVLPPNAPPLPPSDTEAKKHSRGLLFGTRREKSFIPDLETKFIWKKNVEKRESRTCWKRFWIHFFGEENRREHKKGSSSFIGDQ